MLIQVGEQQGHVRNVLAVNTRFTQESVSLSSGLYAYFEVGFVNAGDPATLFIDKIEVSGPSGPVNIYNSSF